MTTGLPRVLNKNGEGIARFVKGSDSCKPGDIVVLLPTNITLRSTGLATNTVLGKWG
jgi:hypothetical protein